MWLYNYSDSDMFILFLRIRRRSFMAHDVFISYSHVDYQMANAICHRFEAEGIRCWYAPRNIEPGREWAEAIVDGLYNSKVMVLIFTEESNVSVQVLREVDNAVSAGVTIIPFKISKAKPTNSMKYYLATLHWLDAVKLSQDKAIDKLLKLTKAALDPKKKRTGIIFTAAGAAAALAVAVLLIWTPWKDGHQLPDTGAVQSGADIQPPVTDADLYAGGAEGGSTLTTHYYYDEDNDSPGAGDYLYSSDYSDHYIDGIQLDRFFGEEKEKLVVPELVDGLPVTEIGKACFLGRKNTAEIVLPDTVENIADQVFEGCSSLKKINWPAHLQSVDGRAFLGTALEEAVIPDTVGSIGYECFSDCHELRYVRLPQGLKKIGSKTFSSCYSLERVYIPDSVTEIATDAFEYSKGTVIMGKKGSYAEKYALAMSMEFREE